MNGRLQRYTIPATMVFMSFILTLILGSEVQGIAKLMDNIKELESTGLITLFVAIGLTNYGLGYVCHVLLSAWMFIFRKGRFVNPDRLFRIFGIPTGAKRKLRNRILRVLNAEFHYRLHSSQNESLVNHFTNRNTGYYITKSSAIAILIGGLSGCICIWRWEQLDFDTPWFWGWAIVSLVLIAVSWWSGNQWNKEFWEAAWRWLEEDLRKFPLRDSVKQEIADLRKCADTNAS